MSYRILIIIAVFFIQSCDISNKSLSKKVDVEVKSKYRNSGFALIYSDNLNNIKKLEDRSLKIYHKSLKKRSKVKITNPKNGNSLIAEVKSNKVQFSNFYNSILSTRIVEILELDIKEPFVEIILVSKNSTFIAKKAKTFDEERTVAQKAPVDGIQINDLNFKEKKSSKKVNKIFSYSIKVADFYYKNTAETMMDRIKKETTLQNINIVKLSKTKYRLLIGPFNDIKSLQESFDKMNLLNFENLEVIKNV